MYEGAQPAAANDDDVPWAARNVLLVAALTVAALVVFACWLLSL